MHGDAIAPSTEYYIAAVDYTSKEEMENGNVNYDFDDTDIKFVTVTTPAE